MLHALLLATVVSTGAPEAAGDPDTAGAAAAAVTTAPTSQPDLAADEEEPGRPLANPMCPVMPAEPADEAFHLVYKGRDVDFCCSTCIQYFRKNPTKYLSRLKQFEGWQSDDPAQATGGLGQGEGGGLGGSAKLDEVWMGSLMKQDLVPFFALAIPLFVAFLLWRKRRLLAGGLGWGKRVLAVHLAWMVFLSGAVVATSFARHAYDLYNLWKDRDRVHFSTFFEFGHPPKPARPDEQPKSLSSVYYRGNDERTPVLFNNGYYRTATFDLVLEDEAGTPVKAGDAVDGKQLYVKLLTKRAPFTAARFFHRKAMEPIFLTKFADPFLGAFGPVPDRVDWTEIKEAWQWQARYPVGRVKVARKGAAPVDLQTASVDEIAAQPGVGAVAAQWLVKYREWNEGIGSTADLIEAGIEGGPLKALSDLLDSEVVGGIVYVAQLIPKGDDMSNIRGSRFHFGLVYDVRIRDGIVQKDSDLWMNYLYRSRKTAAWRIPTTQWFDNKPIPVLPAASGITDPVVLGLQDADQGLIPEAGSN